MAPPRRVAQHRGFSDGFCAILAKALHSCSFKRALMLQALSPRFPEDGAPVPHLRLPVRSWISRHPANLQNIAGSRPTRLRPSRVWWSAADANKLSFLRLFRRRLRMMPCAPGVEGSGLGVAITWECRLDPHLDDARRRTRPDAKTRMPSDGHFTCEFPWGTPRIPAMRVAAVPRTPHKGSRVCQATGSGWRPVGRQPRNHTKRWL